MAYHSKENRIFSLTSLEIMSLAQKVPDHIHSRLAHWIFCRLFRRYLTIEFERIGYLPRRR